MELLKPKNYVKKNKKATGYSIYKIYCALKIHMADTEYISKYGIKTNHKFESYEKRKDKAIFERFAKRNKADECYLIMMYNLVSDPDYITFEFESPAAKELYLKQCSKIDSISTVYSEDLRFIFDLLTKSEKTFKNLFTGEGHPVILQLLLQDKISLETVILMDSFISFISIIDKVYNYDLIWIKWKKKILAYKALLLINNQLAKEIFLREKSHFVIH